MRQMDTDQIITNAAKVMIARGLGITAQMRMKDGSEGPVNIPPEDIPLFLQDAASGIARQFGAYSDDYHAYLAHQGVPKCGGFTTKGKRCKHGVADKQDFADWLKLHRRTYCQIHRG